MARIKFYDDTKELLVCNAVDLILPEKTVEVAFYDSIEGYEEILDLINDIVIIVDTDSFIKRDNIVENYKEAIKRYIKSDLQDYFLSKIKVENYKITVPFKVYLIINIKGGLKVTLDNLGYYTNLNVENMDDDFVIRHNNLINDYADFYTKIICRCVVSTHYFFSNDVYERLKEKYLYLENPEIGEAWLINDPKLPKLREFLWALECYDQGKEVNTLFSSKKYISSIIESGNFQIEKDEYEGHHCTLDYIIFSLIFMRKAPLIIITRDYDNIELSMGYSAYLTNNEGLVKCFVNSRSNFIVFNPFQRLDKVIEEDTDETGKNIIKERREKYQEVFSENTSLDEKLDKCRDFMKQKLGEYEKIEFRITTKNQEPYSIIQEVIQCDPKKFHSTKESFSNPVSYESKVDEKGKEKRIYRSNKPLSEI